MLFGFFPSIFDEEDRQVHLTFQGYSQAAPGFAHAFFSLQAKPATGNMEDAICQGIRDGAGLVYSGIKFHEQAIPGKPMNGIKLVEKTKGGVSKEAASKATKVQTPAAPQAPAKDQPGHPDLESFVFTVVLMPRLAKFFVNCARHARESGYYISCDLYQVILH